MTKDRTREDQTHARVREVRPWTWCSVVGDVPVRVLGTSTDRAGVPRAHVKVMSDMSPYRRGDRLRVPMADLRLTLCSVSLLVNHAHQKGQPGCAGRKAALARSQDCALEDQCS